MAEETAKSALIEKIAFALLPLLFSCVVYLMSALSNLPGSGCVKTCQRKYKRTATTSSTTAKRLQSLKQEWRKDNAVPYFYTRWLADFRLAQTA